MNLIIQFITIVAKSFAPCCLFYSSQNPNNVVINNKKLTLIVWLMVLAMLYYRYSGGEAPIYELLNP